MNEIVVSVICNTYNQKKYIGKALDSILEQSISVPIEILVHDDASTDGTADVVKVYELEHKNVIFPIYQSENQYSQGVKITPEIQIPRARGKYIAFCEGDDYWTDPKKLQIEYDYMESHPECSACCHAYNMVDRNGNTIEERYDFDSDCSIPMSRLIGNQLLLPQLATLLVRRAIITKMGKEFLGVKCRDMIIRLFCACYGDVHYINRNMSAYRRFTEGSWTLRVGISPEKAIEEYKQYIPFLKRFDAYTNYRYSEQIEKAIDHREFEIAILENDFITARSKRAFKKASTKRKIYITIGCFFPKTLRFVRNRKIDLSNAKLMKKGY